MVLFLLFILTNPYCQDLEKHSILSKVKENDPVKGSFIYRKPFVF